MFIPIKRDISEAEAKEEYLSSKDIYTLTLFVEEGRKRLETVDIIGNNTEKIIKDTIAAMIQANPSLAQEANDSRISDFLRDTETILRYITYAVFTGNVSVLDKKFFKELREHYLELEISLDSVIQAISLMKSFTIDCINNFNTENTIENDTSDYSSLLSELEGYFDLVILSLEGNVNQQQVENQSDAEDSSELQNESGSEINTINISQNNEHNIWQRGNRIIVFSSGCSFLGGLIGQLPGALIGAIVGAIYGSILKLETDAHN